VQCERSLTTLAYNLKRVLNLVSFQKLMAATPARKKAGQPMLASVVIPPSANGSQLSCSGQNFPAPKNIFAAGLQRNCRKKVFTRARDFLGG